MRKTFIYCDEYIDLGFIGEHEFVITALNVALPHDEPLVLIKRAVAHVRLEGFVTQELEVTSKVRNDPYWLGVVQSDYLKRSSA